jgi:nucleoid-associated protein YejK
MLRLKRRLQKAVKQYEQEMKLTKKEKRAVRAELVSYFRRARV